NCSNSSNRLGRRAGAAGWSSDWALPASVVAVVLLVASLMMVSPWVVLVAPSLPTRGTAHFPWISTDLDLGPRMMRTASASWAVPPRIWSRAWGWNSIFVAAVAYLFRVGKQPGIGISSIGGGTAALIDLAQLPGGGCR